jgi:hypothetical protein
MRGFFAVRGLNLSALRATVEREKLAIVLSVGPGPLSFRLRLSFRAARGLFANLAMALKDPEWEPSSVELPADSLQKE